MLRPLSAEPMPRASLRAVSRARSDLAIPQIDSRTAAFGIPRSASSPCVWPIDPRGAPDRSTYSSFVPKWLLLPLADYGTPRFPHHAASDALDQPRVFAFRKQSALAVLDRPSWRDAAAIIIAASRRLRSVRKHLPPSNCKCPDNAVAPKALPHPIALVSLVSGHRLDRKLPQGGKRPLRLGSKLPATDGFDACQQQALNDGSPNAFECSPRGQCKRASKPYARFRKRPECLVGFVCSSIVISGHSPLSQGAPLSPLLQPPGA